MLRNISTKGNFLFSQKILCYWDTTFLWPREYWAALSVVVLAADWSNTRQHWLSLSKSIRLSRNAAETYSIIASLTCVKLRVMCGFVWTNLSCNHCFYCFSLRKCTAHTHTSHFLTPADPSTPMCVTQGGDSQRWCCRHESTQAMSMEPAPF